MLNKSILILTLILIATAITTLATLPTSGTPYITPKPAYDNNNLTCNYNWTDNEGAQNITTWYKNDNPLESLNLPIEGGSNETQTHDYSTSQLNGNITGATYMPNGGKNNDGAYYFNSINKSSINWEISPLNETINFQQNFTVCLGVKLENFVNSPYLISNNRGASDKQWDLVTTSTARLQIYSYQNASLTNTIDTNTAVISNNTWYHICAAFDKTNLTAGVFVNGADVTLGTRNANSSLVGQPRMFIGTKRGTSNWLNGTIDHVTIFNYKLSLSQINAEYNAYIKNKLNYLTTDTITTENIIKCGATPNDGTDDGTTVNSTSVTIHNHLTGPTWDTLTTNITTGKSTYHIKISVNVQDDAELYTAKLMENSTGHWTNGTPTDLRNLTSAALQTIIISNSTNNTYNCAKYWINDTQGNQNITTQTCYRTEQGTQPDIELLLIPLGLLFAYLIIYRKSYLAGNIMFILIGITTMAYSMTNIITSLGLVITLGSIANAIYDLTGH